MFMFRTFIVSIFVLGNTLSLSGRTALAVEKADPSNQPVELDIQRSEPMRSFGILEDGWIHSHVHIICNFGSPHIDFEIISTQEQDINSTRINQSNWSLQYSYSLGARGHNDKCNGASQCQATETLPFGSCTSACSWANLNGSPNEIAKACADP